MPSERQDRQDRIDDLDMVRIARMVGYLTTQLDNTGFTAVDFTRAIVVAATPEIARKVLNTNGN